MATSRFPPIASVFSNTNVNGVLSVNGTATKASATSLAWDVITAPAATLTLTGTTQATTATGVNLVSLKAPTITDASAVTVDLAATLYVGGPPTAGGSVTLTAPYAVWSDSGTNRLDGNTVIGGVSAPKTTLHVNNPNSNSVRTTFTQALTNAGMLIETTSTNQTFTPGIFWGTSDGTAPTKPKGGIYMFVDTGAGTTMCFGTSNVFATGITNTAITITPGGSVTIGIAALATTATDGFLYIPTCAGPPTGVPTTQTGTVAMVYDTSNNKLYVYNAAWKGGTAPGAWS